ncbi:hypothetical protein BLOT_004233 [Blomia tropicalis]|nr:hypothetical protein BLOT_004233 [Blomia tropicalis]
MHLQSYEKDALDGAGPYCGTCIEENDDTIPNAMPLSNEKHGHDRYHYILIDKTKHRITKMPTMTAPKDTH